MAVKTKSEILSDITSTIESGAKNTAAEIRAVQTDIVDSAVFPDELSTVAFSGDYDDLSNKPEGTLVNVSDDAYSSDWNGVTDTAPTQNAVYDKFEALDAEKSDTGHTHTISDVTDFDSGDYATAAQGTLADSAVQPGDLATVATTGAFADLTGSPVSDEAFGSGWNGATGVPTKNAIYDKIIVMVSNDAYAGSWDGVTDVAPSKNAVFDKFESLVTDFDDKVDITRLVSPGTGMTGGGTLDADITLSLSSESVASLALANTALQKATPASVTDVTTSRTLDINDANSLLVVNSASAVTLTVDASVFSRGHIVNILTVGAGDVIVADGTATVSVAATATKQLAESGCLATLIFLSSSAARLIGELAAA